jgi:putative transposase
VGVAAFLRELLRHLRGKVIVVWDGGSNHKGPAIRAVTDRFPRLELERLPGYAPDLNPVEMVWSYLKHGLMANFVPRHVRHLDQVVRGHLGKLGTDPAMIRSLWGGSRLPFPDRKLAT